MPEPIIATAFRFVLHLDDLATPGAFLVDPPLSAGDAKVSKDGGAYANLTTLPVVAPAGSSAVQVDLSALEMTVTTSVDVLFRDPDGAWGAQAWGILPTVSSVDTLSADIGVNGAGLTALGDTRLGNLDATISSRTKPADTQARVTLVDTTTVLTNAPADSAGTTTLLARLTGARAGYLDNVNVGGAVASQVDVLAINQSASRRLLLATVGQYERPESGTSTYTVELRTYDGDGAVVNADSTPTLTATGTVTGDLSAQLSAATNPATGLYRWTYTVLAAATAEQVRFDVSALLAASTFTLSAYSQVVDTVAATWSTTDASNLAAVYNKLPSKSYLAGTNNSDGDVQFNEATGNYPGSVASVVADVGITQTGADKVWGSTARTLTAFSTTLALSVWDVLLAAMTTTNSIGNKLRQWTLGADNKSLLSTDAQTGVILPRVTLVDTLTSYTNNTPQTGDAYAKVDTEVAAILAAIAALNIPSTAQINAELVDALATDAYGEPTQGAPGVTLSLAAKLNYLYTWTRNRKTNDGADTKLYADDGTTILAKQLTSENAGVVTKGEWITGA